MVFLVQVLVGTGVGNILKSSLGNKKVGIILISLSSVLIRKKWTFCTLITKKQEN